VNAPIGAPSGEDAPSSVLESPDGLTLRELLGLVPEPGAVLRAGSASDPGPPAGVEVWDPATTPAAGHLVAVPGRPEDEDAVLHRAAAAGASAVLLRADPRDVRRSEALARTAADVGIELLWLTGERPWWPLLRDLGAALSGTPRPASDAGRPDDLFALADEMAASLGGPVILEDATFRVLAYSAFVGRMDRGRAEAILGRRIPDAWLEHLSETGSLPLLRSTTEVVDLLDGPWQARRRLITAVRAGNRQLGVVWVAEGDTPLPDGVARLLRRAAADAVPALLRHLERVDAAVARRARHVQALVDAHPSATSAAAELGFRPNGTFAVLAVVGPAVPVDRGAGDAGPDGLGGADRTSRLVEHVALCCESFRRHAAVTAFGQGALAVVAVPEGADDDSTRRLGRDVARLAGSGPLAPVRSAVSSHGTGLASLARLRDEALGALSVLDEATGPSCVSFAEVEAEVLVRSLVARLGPEVRLTGLDRVVTHDAIHGGELLTTLRGYLHACGSAAAAAAALGVHVTTVRHRLNRVAEVSGLRLDDPAVRVACDLLLRRPDA
jgi:hypothetical protein